MQILPALGAEDIIFHDINSRDQAVGFVVGGMRMDGKRSQAALLTPGLGFRFLEGQGTEEMAMSINESGWIAGATTGRDKRHPVLWRPPDFRQQDLGLPAGFDDGVAVGINDRGVVLVHLWSSPMTARPFLWTEERGYRELPVPGGYTRILGVSLDGRGTVLLQAEQGYGLVRDERSFLTRNGAILAIPQPRGAREVQYRLLNDRGWLAGTAKRNVAPDLERGFVAKPVP
jgi:hypothetical protein